MIMIVSRWRQIALKRWGQDAEWIRGDGRFALVADCNYTTVTLHETLERAEEVKAEIDRFGCGGRCIRSHKIMDLKP